MPWKKAPHVSLLHPPPVPVNPISYLNVFPNLTSQTFLLLFRNLSQSNVFFLRLFNILHSILDSILPVCMYFIASTCCFLHSYYANSPHNLNPPQSSQIFRCKKKTGHASQRALATPHFAFPVAKNHTKFSQFLVVEDRCEEDDGKQEKKNTSQIRGGPSRWYG